MKLGLAYFAAAALGASSLIGAGPSTSLRAGQSAPPEPATGLIVGRVIDGSTERPVGSVVVTLTPFAAASAPAAGAGGRGAGTPPAPRVVTDTSGRFVFSGLAAGLYNLRVSTTTGDLLGGYGMRRPGGSAQPFELADGARVNDVTVRVWRPASISGTLTDQFGDPVAETRVSALRVTIAGGVRRFATSRTTITDDRGAFHLSRLEAGEYTVSLPFTEVTIPLSVQAAYETASAGGNVGREQFRIANGESGAPEPSNDGFRVGDAILVRTANSYGAEGAIGPMLATPSPDDTGRVLVYPFTFFPGVTSLAEAATFVLESGQDRAGTDFQVRLVPSARVTGRVVGPEGPVGMVGVRLVASAAGDAGNESGLETATTITDAGGAFTFLGVPAGQYSLRVTRVPINERPQTMTTVSIGGVTTFSSAESNLPPPPIPDTPTLSASIPIAVVDRDVTDVMVSLRAGPRVSGRLEYSGAAAPLTEDQLVRATVTLEPADGRSAVGASGRGQFDAAGRFSTLGLVPGRYVLRVGGNLGPWGLESATAGGRDIADAPITIDSANVTDVVIKLTDRTASLTGSVRSPSGPDPTAVVLAFPADRAAWTNTGLTLRRLRSSRATARGTYRIPNLPPGDYFVIAIDDRLSDNWRESRRLEALSRTATRVTIQPGESHATDLTTEIVR